MPTQPRLRLEVLLAHEPLVRSVARAVLRGDPQVDDVVQDTWIAALQGGPREPRAVSSWLRSVARHRALNVLREQGRRRKRERAVARTERAPDIDIIRERESIRRSLVEAILGLAEPYRTCLLLRFYEDRTPREIALQLGIPRETAKTRIRRGLERLRTHLAGDPRRPGASPACVVTGLAELGNVSGLGTATAVGGVVMGTKSILTALAVVTIGALGLWTFLDRGGADEPQPRHLTPPAKELATAAPPETPEPALEVRKRAPLVTRPDPVPQGAAHGLIVDLEDSPLEGVAVRLVATGAERLGARPEPAARGDGYATSSDAAGRFALATAPAENQEVLLLKSGFEVGTIAAAAFTAAGTDPVKVRLKRGLSVAGSVHTTEGAPIVVARITATPQPVGGRFVSYTVESDKDGAFQFHHLPRGAARLHVEALGFVGAVLAIDSDTGGEPVPFTLTRRALLVRVLDARTGKPIKNAGALLQTTDGSFRTGLERARKAFWGSPLPAGWLALRFFNQDYVFPHAKGVLYIVAVGYETVRREVARDKQQQPPTLEIRMQRKLGYVSLGGKVLGASPAALEVRMPRPANWVDRGDASLPLLVTIPAASNGSFAIRGLPEGAYRLIARAAGAAVQSREVVAPTTDLSIELAPGGSIAVAVEPAGPAWVHLEQPGGRAHWSQQTNAEGHTQFEGLPPGPYRATIRPAKSPGRLMPRQWLYVPVRAEVRLAAGGEEALTLPLPARRAVTLLVVDESGAGREGVRARLTVNPGAYASLVPGGRPSRKPGTSPTTSADGRIELLAFPGVYGVELQSGSQQRTTWFRVKRTGSASATFLLARKTHTVKGRVLDADTSAPIAGRRVEVMAAETAAYELLGHGHTDERGHFTIHGVPAQRVVVVVATNLNAARSLIPDNEYGSAKVEVDASQAAPAELTVRIRKSAAWLGEAGGLRLSLAVTYADTQAPLERGFVRVEVLREGAWVAVGHGRIVAGGKLDKPLPVPRGERYRIDVSGPLEADPPYASQTVEGTVEGELLVVVAALKRDAGE